MPDQLTNVLHLGVRKKHLKSKCYFNDMTMLVGIHAGGKYRHFSLSDELEVFITY